MFIEKIAHIKGIGNYQDFTASDADYCWNGEFAKNNFIYAENACGKTTLAQIIRSLIKSSDIDEIRRRKTFNYQGMPSIEVMVNDGTTSSLDLYNGVDWAKHYDNIIVFDTYFVERNVYVLSPSKKTGDADTIKVLLGDDSIDILDKISRLKMRNTELGGTKGNLVQEKKRRDFFLQISKIDMTVHKHKKDLSPDVVNKRIKEIDLEIEKNKKEIGRLQQKLNTNTVSKQYIERTNKFLALFAPDIKLSALYTKTKTTIMYGIEVKGHLIRSNTESTSLKRVLSDGEKNALAFSFFLAKLEMLKNLDKYVVVFDDPLSSMDATRRSASMYQLCLMANKVSQFILLSHDKLFVRDIVWKARKFGIKQDDSKILRIGKTPSTSAIMGYNIEEDTKTGLAKDLEMIIDFRDSGDKSKYSADSVAESIRRVVEGILRLKYSSIGCFGKSKTLGAIIDVITKNEGSVFSYDKKHIDTLREINYYTTDFHHSDPSQESVFVNKIELVNYCNRTLELLLHL